MKPLESHCLIRLLEICANPIHVRLESSTRGHVLVVMLAHRIIQELQHCWAGENLTVEEGIKQLGSLCVTEVIVNDMVKDQLIPEARDQVKNSWTWPRSNCPGNCATPDTLWPPRNPWKIAY